MAKSKKPKTEIVKINEIPDSNLVEVNMVISKGKFSALCGALQNHKTVIGIDLLGMISRSCPNSLTEPKPPTYNEAMKEEFGPSP